MAITHTGDQLDGFTEAVFVFSEKRINIVFSLKIQIGLLLGFYRIFQGLTIILAVLVIILNTVV